MTRAAIVALAILLVAAPAAGAKRPKLRCDSGVTVFAEGKLRLFGVRFGNADEWGYEEYTCLRGRRRPFWIGGVFKTGGTASLETPVFAVGGGRYLGKYSVNDGEGGPDASYAVYDLKTRRTLISTDSVVPERVPAMRVASNGALITDDGEAVDVRTPGVRGFRTLSTPGVAASDLALVGSTVYWTEHPDGAPALVRSATLAGVPDGPEAHSLEPNRPRAKGGACRAARGTTIAASPSVRVYERTTRSGSVRRLACRIGAGAPVRIAAGAPPPRIVGDRWLLALGATTAVVDTRTGETVTRVGGGTRAATLLSGGSAAWIAEDGRVLAQRPAADGPVELAPASPAPSALASSRHTVYWTADGAPHGARP